MEKKLSLVVDTLAVESFATDAAADVREGTVHGYATRNTGPCPTYPYVTCIEPCVPPPP